MKKLLTLAILTGVFLTVGSSHSAVIDTAKVYGVTIDAVSKISNIVTALSKHSKKPTTRIVFDEWMPAADYLSAVNKINPVSFVMGELLDSYYFSQYNLSQYTARSYEYLNLLGNKVDIWEIGNEINGEWLGSMPDVVAKMDTAYKIFRNAGKKTALTLYYNKNCWENPQNEMFRWAVNNVPKHMKDGLDYVWVSYYEDDCNKYQPDWQKVIDSLGKIFPNSKLGIGECGTIKSLKKAEYIKRYYRMHINHPRYVGGYFWWYYRQDCVPYTKALWGTLDSAMCGITSPFTYSDNNIKSAKLSNYPNPFNPVTKISYYVPAGQRVSLIVYDMTGKEVAKLVDEWKAEGGYSVDFLPDNLSSGIYFCKLNIGNASVINRMMLIK
ncbi:MAG: T9SS type A sorting domain-containing protein [Ignavibacteria bacterium]|nr:T9SS type A sorting domain-containing protein [Ignavibacteria bacterium]